MWRWIGSKTTRLGWTPTRSYSRSPVLSAASRESKKKPIHITSENLCDNLIKRLAPSFDRTNPIDIIDLYPGIGLWSTKVNDFLKPRRHILLEPNVAEYGSQLEAITRRSPNYKLLPWDPAHDTTLMGVFDSTYLPEQLERDTSQGRTARLNPSLLVMANLTRHRHSYASKLFCFLRYMEACFDQSLMHKYGLVRIIVTFADKDCEFIIPRTVIGRRRLALIAEAAGEEIIQLCSEGHETNSVALRGPDLWKQSANATAARAKAAHIKTPHSRKPPKIEMAPRPLTTVDRNIKYFQRPKQDWHDTFLEYYYEWKEYIQANPGAANVPDKTRAAKFLLLRKRLLLENRQTPIVQEACQKQLEIDSIHQQLRGIMRDKPYRADTFSLLSRLRSLVSSRDELYARLTPLAKSHVIQRQQDIHGLTDHPTEPLLFWDRRPYEPLRVQPSEFDPPIPCGMIDFRPSTTSPMLTALCSMKSTKTGSPTVNSYGPYRELLTIFHYIVRTVSRGNLKPIDRALLRPLFPGRAMPELVSAVPALERLAKVSASYDHPHETPESTNSDADASEIQATTQVPENLRLYFDEDCFSETSLRQLSARDLWSIAVEWERWPLRRFEARDLWKLLGGQKMAQIDSSFEQRQ